MKVLGIVGSPRKGGNTDTLVSQVLKGAVSEGMEAEKIYLDELQMRPCQSCAGCQATGNCVIEDDFHMVLKKIKTCNAIVLGSPIYCQTVTAQTKILIDRVESSQLIKSYTPDGRVKFYRRIRDNKIGVIICIGDLSTKSVLEQASHVMKFFLKDIGVKVVDEILENGLSKAGAVMEKKALLERAFKVGTSLPSLCKVKCLT